MIEKLERLVDEVGGLQSKLILLIGAPQTGKTTLLHALARNRDVTPLNVGVELGSRLAGMPRRPRLLQTAIILRELVEQHASGDLVLLDNIELLFDRTLKLDPLDLLKFYARAQRVVAVWPGDTGAGRLTYADIGHPEHQDYGLAGLVPFEIKK